MQPYLNLCTGKLKGNPAEKEQRLIKETVEKFSIKIFDDIYKMPR